MDIKNFAGIQIRLGEFPVCLDVTNIPEYHSSNGIMSFLHIYRGPGEQHFIQIRKRKDIQGLVLFFFEWEIQLENLPDYIGDVVFDSRLITDYWGGNGSLNKGHQD